jgi:protein-S-isoprenylcysteine O-methyltransferase Ste14
MNLDATFRDLMLAGILILMPVGLYYRVKSQSTGEPLDRRQEGVFILATLRPIALIFWGAIIAFLISPASMAWSSLPLPAWMRWSGAALAVAGGALLVWTFHTLGPNLTDTVVTRRVHTLVTRGPYRFVRHPFYDSGALIVVATALMMANWFVLMTGALAVVLLAVRSRTEEDRLLARFGEAYLAYRSTTGRFVPRMRREAAEPTSVSQHRND